MIKSLAEFCWNLRLKLKVFPKAESSYYKMWQRSVSVLHGHNLKKTDQKQGLLNDYDSIVYY